MGPVQTTNHLVQILEAKGKILDPIRVGLWGLEIRKLSDKNSQLMGMPVQHSPGQVASSNGLEVSLEAMKNHVLPIVRTRIDQIHQQHLMDDSMIGGKAMKQFASIVDIWVVQHGFHCYPPDEGKIDGTVKADDTRAMRDPPTRRPHVFGPRTFVA